MKTPERHYQIKEALLAALEREPSQRAAFLDQACAEDPVLRTEIETLLAGEQAAADFIEVSPFREFIADAQWPGRLLDDRYRIDRELGRGGMGLVFLAHDQKLNQTPVVIKVRQEGFLNAEHKKWVEQKFKQEMAALALINHPGVVRPLDIGELPDGRAYLVMQYVPGETLRSLIKPQGIELKRAGNLIRQIGHALAAAHEQGVIHRDLKPENILLQTAGGEKFVKLIDFGIATVLDTPSKIKTTLVAGTPDYMAPEQLRGKPSAASDIYAMGVIAYELLTGCRPFDSEAQQESVDLQRAGVTTKPYDLPPGLPEAAHKLILKSLDFDPQVRPQSARDFGDALAQLTSEADKPAPLARHRTSKFAKQWLLLALLIVLGGIGATLWRYTREATRQRETAQVAPVAERSLIYSLLVQKDPKRYPNSKPFILPGEIIFEAGYQVRLKVSSPQSGYLYVINEGPAQTNGLPDFNVLFPVTTLNGGSAEIKPNQPTQLPPPSGKSERDWFLFDKEEGVEKIWLIWSEQSVPELEAVKGRANPRERGVISDPSHIEAVRRYLVTEAANKPEIGKDEVNKQTILKGKGAVLVGVVKLEHH